MICGNINDLHVDHIINFDDLAYNFINKMKNDCAELPVKFKEANDQSNQKCFLLSDRIFEEKWKDFHEKNAKLQILCQGCNLSKPRPKNNFLL